MNERLTELGCEEFTERLAARESVPGGGGAAALAGALAAALCSMAGNFTLGNPRFADVADDVRRILEDADDVRYRLLELVEEDAEGFAPLAAAYALPRDDPHRHDQIQRATKGACMAPLAMMGECCRAIVLLEQMGERCSRLLESDVASGAMLVGGALACASVNVFVNTAALDDHVIAGRIEATAEELLSEFSPRAERLAARMVGRVRGEEAHG